MRVALGWERRRRGRLLDEEREDKGRERRCCYKIDFLTIHGLKYLQKRSVDYFPRGERSSSSKELVQTPTRNRRRRR